MIEVCQHKLDLGEAGHLDFEADRLVHVHGLCVDRVSTSQPGAFAFFVLLANLGHCESAQLVALFIVLGVLFCDWVSLLYIDIDVILSLNQSVLKAFYHTFSLQRVTEVFLENFLAMTLAIDVKVDGLIDEFLIDNSKFLCHFAADIVLKNYTVVIANAQERGLIVICCLARKELVIKARVFKASRCITTKRRVIKREMLKVNRQAHEHLGPLMHENFDKPPIIIRQLITNRQLQLKVA